MNGRELLQRYRMALEAITKTIANSPTSALYIAETALEEQIEPEPIR